MLLSSPDALDARAALLAEPRMRAIEAWRARATSEARPLPHADPLDGGTAARLLLLLETPGPGAARLRFVSRDNPTGTGRNLRRFLGEAGIAREEMLIWNAVPWVIHAPGARNRAVRAGEVRDGLAMLPGFLDLLPRLAVAVLSGRVARGAAAVIEAARPGLPVIPVPHPSPTIVCTSPGIGARIAEGLAEVAAILR
ncbi:uracil-DNA glycosylase [Sphingomonas rubra]|uniref:Uracil DNA glycosylase superfamily protein n=1 Tax=Sphingomonas rubra TaxID=634430 RepID=A0A1I5SQZ1_9SPHN|nr:uracil-DNA glycosylase [Sphingomonas rubra]SFP73190.1 Uracil DNA glycosylase superfamily protein [Sphingomonas rubra]